VDLGDLVDPAEAVGAAEAVGVAAGAAVGAAVGDARSSGTSARSVTRQQRAVMRSESAYVHDPLNSLSAQRGVGLTASEQR
jgi:hypothetical protein